MEYLIILAVIIGCFILLGTRKCNQNDNSTSFTNVQEPKQRYPDDVFNSKNKQGEILGYPPYKIDEKTKDWEKIFKYEKILFEKYYRLIRCLVFVSRSDDGKMLDDERNIIIETCIELSEYKDIPRYHIEYRLKEVRIKLEEFIENIEYLSANDEHSFKILCYKAKKIINLKKSISAGGKYCLEAIDKYKKTVPLNGIR